VRRRWRPGLSSDILLISPGFVVLERASAARLYRERSAISGNHLPLAMLFNPPPPHAARYDSIKNVIATACSDVCPRSYHKDLISAWGIASARRHDDSIGSTIAMDAPVFALDNVPNNLAEPNLVSQLEHRNTIQISKQIPQNHRQCSPMTLYIMILTYIEIRD